MPVAGSQISRRPTPAVTGRIGWLAAASLTVVALGSSVGCSTSPPEFDALRGSIQEAADADPAIQLSDDQISCVTQQLLDSDLSATTLNGLAGDFDRPEVLSSERDTVQSVVARVTATCVAGG